MQAMEPREIAALMAAEVAGEVPERLVWPSTFSSKLCGPDLVRYSL
jgi:hypothetical protein